MRFLQKFLFFLVILYFEKLRPFLRRKIMRMRGKAADDFFGSWSIFGVSILILGEIHATPCIHLVATVGKKNLYTANKELNWFDSLEYCHGIGMSLAVIETDRELNAIEEYLQRCSAKHHVWLAATDLFKEGSFTWMSSGSAVSEPVAQWLDGQPDGGLRQNCLLINGLTLKWEDQSCRFVYCRPLCQLFS